jgi:hypothetical protein
MVRLAPLIRARGQTENRDLIPFRWAPVGINPTYTTASLLQGVKARENRVVKQNQLIWRAAREARVDWTMEYIESCESASACVQ